MLHILSEYSVLGDFSVYGGTGYGWGFTRAARPRPQFHLSSLSHPETVTLFYFCRLLSGFLPSSESSISIDSISGLLSGQYTYRATATGEDVLILQDMVRSTTLYSTDWN